MKVTYRKVVTGKYAVMANGKMVGAVVKGKRGWIGHVQGTPIAMLAYGKTRANCVGEW